MKNLRGFDARSYHFFLTEPFLFSQFAAKEFSLFYFSNNKNGSLGHMSVDEITAALTAFKIEQDKRQPDEEALQALEHKAGALVDSFLVGPLCSWTPFCYFASRKPIGCTLKKPHIILS